MNTYNFKKRNFFTLSPHLLGLLFLGIGLFILISPYVMQSDNSTTKVLMVGGSNVVFGLLVVFSYGGTQIDFTTQKYVDYYSLAGFQFGKAKNLPAIRLVKAMTIKKHVTMVSNGVNPSLSGNVYVHVLFLYAASTTPFFVFEYPNKNKCLEDAKYLSEHLKAKLEVK